MPSKGGSNNFNVSFLAVDWIYNSARRGVELEYGPSVHGLSSPNPIAQVYYGPDKQTNVWCILETDISSDGNGTITLFYPHSTGYNGSVTIVG